MVVCCSVVPSAQFAIYSKSGTVRSLLMQVSAVTSSCETLGQSLLLSCQARFSRYDAIMHIHGVHRELSFTLPEMTKCEAGHNNGGKGAGGSSDRFEATRGGGATGRAAGQLEQRILDLRLRWALRRIQQRMVFSFQRRCEMRTFVALRLQYLYRRRRSRIRAALTIQRFIRPILHKRIVRHRY